MVVAIQEGLGEIKKELLKRGFDVVDLETYNYPIDAIIYKGTSFQISYVSGNNMPAMSSGIRENYGVFMVNSNNRSIDELENMLRTRYYSPLF